MSEFTDVRTQLSAVRSQRSAAAAELAMTREQLRDVRSQIAALQRVAAGDQGAQLAALQKHASELSDEMDRLREQVGAYQSDATGLLARLAGLGDPPSQVGELDDSIPILLFPVRLETRFHSAAADVPTPGARGVAQLWIRIYPDDCQIDSFEELLTHTELDNAREFWASMWRAGGVEAQERGAWRSLVGGASTGRAAYIVEQFAPTNPAERPAKIDPQDVVLVILPQMDVTAAEQAAAFTYYTAVWKAEGDASATEAADAAFEAAVGKSRADEMRAKFAPEAAGQDPPQPYTSAEVRGSCAILRLPDPPPAKTTAWSQAPKAFALPDRFVALLWGRGATAPRLVVGNPVRDGLAVGPDPSLPPGEQIQKDGDDLRLNDDLLWLADFERAVSVGMGIEVDLSTDEGTSGFDRLVVLGLRLSSDSADGRTQLETLIAHHHASTHGFGLVPQGSATNNSDTEGTAYTWVDDPDAAYDVVFKGTEAYTDTTDPFERRDGEWLADALGIGDGLMKRIPNAAGRDQGEARAMNAALWQGTLGYQLEEMLPPVFTPADTAATRQFFARYVSARGPLPAVRVGKQPYGVLVATAQSRYRSSERGDYLQRLQTLLMRMDADWNEMANSVSHVGEPADPQQTLLDVVGLHSGSVEYHQRYAESFDQLYNKLVLQFGQVWGAVVARWLRTRGEQLLTGLGASPASSPPILGKFFYGDSPLLTGPVVDDVPLSETEPLRACTAAGQNYIEWLATSSLDVIRRQDFGGNPAPVALLYLMLRHAAMLGNWDAGIRFLETRGLVDSAVARREPSFIHVQDGSEASESKFTHLYAAHPEITGDPAGTLAEFVLRPAVLASAPETQDLREIVAALTFLKDTPTARLERAFADHIDCCTYRLDAWKTGIALTRLEEMRPEDLEGTRAGIYLGAFGWLENLSPRSDPLVPVGLDPELAAIFELPQDPPLKLDPANSGYIHAPSLNQAAAAAVLKNGYTVNASPTNPDAMAVNLSSARVRGALAVLEGMRGGQPLGALLGYRFERGLHDDHGLAEVDKFIYPLRQAFPLVANQLKSTVPVDPTDITLLEARNVIDGAKLVTRIRTPGQASYPFGLPLGTGPGELPPASPQEQAAIDAEADALADLYDSIADLELAESVYQVVQGNFDRAAANTAAFSQGSRPPETLVVDTPGNGLSLTHRVTLHLDPTADTTTSPSAVPMTPRASAQAPLNLWLAGRLPDPSDVVVRVTYATPALAGPKTVTLSQTDLGVQPLDLLYLLNLDLEQAMSELDDRIVQAVRYGPDGHPDIAVMIQYTEPVHGKVTLFELAALTRSLRALVLQSRTLGPADLAMPLEATQAEMAWDDAELGVRVGAAIATLTTLRDDLVPLKTDGSDLDDYARKASNAFLRTSLHGIPQLGVGQIHGDIKAIYDAIAAKVQAVVDRWNEKAEAYASLLATWPTLTTDEARIALLRQAEGVISATTTASPPDVATYKAQVESLKFQFGARLTQFEGLLGFGGAKLTDFAAAAAAMTPLAAAHDATPFDVGDQQGAITTLRATLVSRVTAAGDDLTKRIDDAGALITAAANATSSPARVDQLMAAGRPVLGDDIALIPRFRLADDRGLEFAQCVSGSAALLTDLHAAGRRFPVDDWLYGLARVRDKLGAWENAAVLSEAFGATRLELTPVQLPFQADDRWRALEFDASAGSADRLLYTAHFAEPFHRTADQCGLLVDEWPEVVPAKDVISGLTFNFDRPSSQPPQAMLLAVPPALTGSWSWDDLVATLVETLQAAKSRAVEPAQIDASSYAQFLPATLMAVTLYQITIATNLALNNHIYDRIGS